MILKGAKAGFRIVEVPVSYYPRIGASKISGTVKRHDWRMLVHPDADRALLFLAETACPAAHGMNIRGAILMQTPPQRNDACTLGHHGKGTQTGHGQDAPSSENSSGSGHRTLSLSSGRHYIAGAVFGYSRGCDYVSCCGCGSTDAGGARHGARGGAERRGPCGRSHFGVCAFHSRGPTTRGCLQQRQPAFAGFGSCERFCNAHRSRRGCRTDK